MKSAVLITAMVLGLVGLAGSADGSPLTWNTCLSPCCYYSLTSSVRIVSGGNPSGSTEADVVFTFQALEDATKTIVTRGFESQNTDGTGNAVKAEIKIWGGGLGVNSSTYPASSDEGSPDHAVDNHGPDEFIVYELPADNTKPLSFKIGWKYSDADIKTWIGGALSLDLLDLLALGTFNWNQGNTLVSSYGFVAESFSNVVENTAQSFTNDAVGRYLVIGAQSGSDNQDYFKVLQLTASVPVPEPALPVLLWLGLLGVTAQAARRRRTRRSRTRAAASR